MNNPQIEIICTKEQKEALIEVMSEGMKLGKVFPKDKMKEELEDSIKWTIRAMATTQNVPEP